MQKSTWKIIVAIIGAIAIIIAAISNRQHSDSSTEKNNIRPKTYFLAGIVMDENKNAISGADINVVGRNEHTLSEKNGNFKIVFKDSVTTVRLIVTKAGFAKEDRSFDLPTEQAIIKLDAINSTP